MIPNRGRIGAGEAKLPRTLHRAPRKKTLRHIPRLTHSPAMESNLRLDIPQHTSDLGLGGRSTLDPPTPLTSPPATHYLKPNHRPRFLSLDPNKLSHTAGCNCASSRAVHTHQSQAHAPKDSLTPYISRMTGKPIAYSHRLYPTFNPTRQRFKRPTDKRVRFPTERQLRTKVQIPTTTLHTKPIQRTYSFTPLHSSRLPTYGTAVRRGRTEEQSDEVASNLIHPQPKIVNGEPQTPFIMQVEGHPPHTSTTQKGSPHIITPPPDPTYLSGTLVTSTKKSHPIKTVTAYSNIIYRC